jgi:hypothetical protein
LTTKTFSVSVDRNKETQKSEIGILPIRDWKQFWNFELAFRSKAENVPVVFAGSVPKIFRESFIKLELEIQLSNPTVKHTRPIDRIDPFIDKE